MQGHALLFNHILISRNVKNSLALSNVLARHAASQFDSLQQQVVILPHKVNLPRVINKGRVTHFNIVNTRPRSYTQKGRHTPCPNA